MESLYCINSEIVKGIREKAISQEWELMRVRYLSNNPLDNYLFVTMCYIPQKDEYVVSLFNNNDKGFYEGYYSKDHVNVITKYYNKN